MSENLPVPADDSVLALATDHPQAKKVVAALGRATPKNVRKPRPGPGGRTFTYAPWAYYARVLNRVFGPTWSFEFAKDPDWRKLPPIKKGTKVTEREEVMLVMRLRTPWGVQESAGDAIYYPSNPEQSRGAVIQSAQSTALKRAAARWGVALDLYMDVDDEQQFEADVELGEAKTAWKSALSRCGLTPTAAVSLLSKRLADDPDALVTLDDCLAATGREGAAAYWALIDELGKEGDGGES